MKINKIKIGLIALVLFLAPTRSNSSACLSLLKGSRAGITAVTIAECSFLMISTGGVIAVTALTAISAYKNRIMPDNSLDVQSLYQQGVAEYKATGVVNPTQQDSDMAGSLKVIDTIASTLDTNLGYSSGTTNQFFAQAFEDNPNFNFIDVVNFASNAVQKLGTASVEVGANSTKITLPDSYRSFDDYIIRNNITTTDKLTDLITQASDRANGGLLPETYEPSVPSGPTGPNTPVGPKTGNQTYQELQEAVASSNAQMSTMIDQYMLGGPGETALINYRTLLIQQYQAASEEEKAQAQEDIDNYNTQVKEANITDSGVTIEPTDL